MKTIVLGFFLSLLVNNLNSQVKDTNEMRKVCHEMLKLIKEKSIVSDSFNWVLFPKKIDSIILSNNHKDSFRMIRNFIIQELRQKGDNHSSYFSKNRLLSWQKEKDSFLYPNCKILDSSFGFIDMPSLASFNGIEIKNYAETIRIQIKKIDEKYLVKGWIIDLRKNRGGNFWNMLSGINPLIEDGVVGFSISHNKTIEKWVASAKNPMHSNSEIIEYKCKTKNPKIVVLIDSLSSSAAEAVCISLYEVPNVIFMGNNTGGYTSNNQIFLLPNGERFNLAVGFFADRNRNVYKGKLKPNLYFHNEEILKAAKKWILEE
mgnify:CR=1 FL=1